MKPATFLPAAVAVLFVAIHLAGCGEGNRAVPPSGQAEPAGDAPQRAAAGPQASAPSGPELDRLAAEIEELRAEVDGLRAQVAALAQDGADSLQQLTQPSGATNASGEAVYGKQALVDAGIDEPRAAWIQGRLDQVALKELYLKDQAIREGWLNTARYRKAMRELRGDREAMREEINNDDTYDRLLYATGRQNRVVVIDVMQNSPAEQYGLQSGDVVQSYDGRRIFTIPELQQATAAGETGAMVLVEIERDGGQVTLYLPRGPIGGRLSVSRTRP